MGNSNSNQLYHIRKYDPTEWVLLGKVKHCQILRNSRNGMIAQGYNLSLDINIPFIQNMQRYRYRQQANHNFVVVYQVQKQQTEYLCQAEELLKVITERIPVRLSQIQNLTILQGFYILVQSLIGFKHILEMHGIININDEMIGFTNQGVVRVWLNQNFASNYPNQNIQNIFNNLSEFKYSRAGSQAKMINQIIYSIQNHLKSKRFPDKFSQMYKSQNTLDFNISIQLTLQFIQNQRLQIPKNVRIDQFLQTNQKFPLQFYSNQKNYPIQQKYQSQLVKQAPQQTIRSPQPPTYFINSVRQRGLTNPGRFQGHQKNLSLKQIPQQRKQTVSSLSSKNQSNNVLKNNLQQRPNITQYLNNGNIRQNQVYMQNQYKSTNNIQQKNNLIPNNNQINIRYQIKPGQQIPIIQEKKYRQNNQVNIQKPFITHQNNYQIQPMPITTSLNTKQFNNNNRGFIPYTNAPKFVQKQTQRFVNQNYNQSIPTVRHMNMQTQEMLRPKRSYDTLPTYKNNEMNRNTMKDDDVIYTQFNSKQTQSFVKNIPIDEMATTTYQQLRTRLLQGNEKLYRY